MRGYIINRKVLIMKLGIIRCQQTEAYCPGSMDFKVISKRMGAFEGIEEDIIINGFVSCGGCPGKQINLRIREYIKRGTDTIAFASCMSKGTPIGFKCPHYEAIMAAVKKEFGDQIKILEYTH